MSTTPILGIDFFLLDVRLLPKVITTEYHSITISDYALTSLLLFTCPQPLRPWRFNCPSSEECYKQFLQFQITMFFELNDLPDTGRFIL